MNKKDQEKLAKLVQELKAIKDRIAAERDKMRAVLSDYEDILQTAEDADEHFDRGIDLLSQYL